MNKKYELMNLKFDSKKEQNLIKKGNARFLFVVIFTKLLYI